MDESTRRDHASFVLEISRACWAADVGVFPTARGGHENEFVDATNVIATTTASSNSSISIPPECVDKPCLPESFYFKAQPQGLFSWQVPPCSDFYSFVCTEDLLNRTHPQWLPYKHASVGYLYRSALRYVRETTARTRETFLSVLESIGLGGFPFLQERRKHTWRLDEPIALSLRLLDVAPFFHLKLPDVHAEYQDILLTRRSPIVPGLEVHDASKHLDRLISTWWALRTLMPSLRRQTMTDIEATLTIFKDIAKASTAGCEEQHGYRFCPKT
ncbi:hypothetical protein HPB51_000626 [Rhipicephalus microplus]|uniref:Uncharacterized protein n=1 Tax=Rhipicephalus microplus TaxID=6941 RepID=A0A9J6E563_RHIMP|nr:hypothetical protein HPB51_000626 [Rhipicephalus microplus]